MKEGEIAEYVELRSLAYARDSFQSFIEYMKPNYQMTWMHKLLANVLQTFVESKTNHRLMVFMPPRHGKTEQISRMLPAWLFGHCPDFKIIACSYGADLARMLNRDVQRIMDSEAYLKVFPNTKLSKSRVKTATSGSWLRNSDMFEVVGHGGQYIASGVGGGVTGKGANIVLLDDLLKNMDEARSSLIRNKIFDFYTSTAYTRLEPPGKVCIVNTRWHEDDICGRLLDESRRNPNADKWKVLSFPAICEHEENRLDERLIGQALWPERFPLERLNAIKATVGPTVFNALFQQRPAPAEGGLFKKHCWQFYKEIPQLDTIVQSWDLAFKGTSTSDFVACLVIGKKGGNFYVLDYLKERLDINGTMAAIRMMSKKWPSARRKLVEDKANGPAVIDLLKNEIPGLTPVNPRGGKESRANAVAPYQESGNVWLPYPETLTWVNEFIANAGSFPAVANDDDIDALSQALIYLGGDTSEKLRRLVL